MMNGIHLFCFTIGYLRIEAVTPLLNNGKYFSWNVYKRDCRFDACRCSSLIDDYVVIGKNDEQEIEQGFHFYSRTSRMGCEVYMAKEIVINC